MSARIHLRAVLLLAGAGSAVAGTGCGSQSDTASQATTPAPAPRQRLLDTARVERAIVASVKAQRHVKARVSCPAAVAQREGVVFSCTATSSIGKATFVATQTDDKGHVTYVAK